MTAATRCKQLWRAQCRVTLTCARTHTWSLLHTAQTVLPCRSCPSVQRYKGWPIFYSGVWELFAQVFCVCDLLRQYINGGVCKLSHRWSRQRLSATHSGASITVHCMQEQHMLDLRLEETRFGDAKIDFLAAVLLNVQVFCNVRMCFLEN